MGSANAPKKKYHQNSGKQHHLAIAPSVERHMLIGKEPVMLAGMTLVDRCQTGHVPMHDPAVAQVLDQIGIDERQRQSQIFQQTNRFQLTEGKCDATQTEGNHERKMRLPRIPRTNMLATILLTIAFGITHIRQIASRLFKLQAGSSPIDVESGE